MNNKHDVTTLQVVDGVLTLPVLSMHNGSVEDVRFRCRAEGVWERAIQTREFVAWHNDTGDSVRVRAAYVAPSDGGITKLYDADMRVVAVFGPAFSHIVRADAEVECSVGRTT